MICVIKMSKLCVKSYLLEIPVDGFMHYLPVKSGRDLLPNNPGLQGRVGEDIDGTRPGVTR